ncbi:hypothetical protein E4T44_11901 [Aureobasidium sp. EXF-8845]|nr:hypothetical protein E4T45_11738 [Aureobasidium sp. EXF-8846]KAI4798969.1 hypothetical protein E4T44_11901 [Aureobasidium sp. EXF-8845]
MPSTATFGTLCYTETESTLDALPDELLLQILGHLDYPFLLALSRVSHRLRSVSLDRVLHLQRLHRLELEKFKEGLRSWLEKKAKVIKKHKFNVGGVGILVLEEALLEVAETCVSMRLLVE